MLFKLSDKIKVETETIDNSNLFFIDNFYENPNLVKQFIISNKPLYHKSDDFFTYNGIYFHDMRHKIECQEVEKVYLYLQTLCNQRVSSTKSVITNYFNFLNCKFNNYSDNYWWPHYDKGYTAIVYLNEDDFECGTNLYENLNKDSEPPKIPEHYCPWRKKNNFRLIKTLTPKFNRLVMFDALKFCHGMNISNNKYEKDFRLNQVLFFNE